MDGVTDPTPAQGAPTELPAFPRDHAAEGHNGMTLRDYFAAKALQGICANPGAAFQANSRSGWDLVNCTEADVVAVCFSLADAMLAARSTP